MQVVETEEETQVPVKKSLVEVKRTGGHVEWCSKHWDHVAEGVIKSFCFRSQTTTTNSKVFRRAHIRLGYLSLEKLEQRPKYQ